MRQRGVLALETPAPDELHLEHGPGPGLRGCHQQMHVRILSVSNPVHPGDFATDEIEVAARQRPALAIQEDPDRLLVCLFLREEERGSRRGTQDRCGHRRCEPSHLSLAAHLADSLPDKHVTSSDRTATEDAGGNTGATAGRRGARPARREERAYREDVSDEPSAVATASAKPGHSPDMNGPGGGWRSRAGCIGGQSGMLISAWVFRLRPCRFGRPGRDTPHRGVSLPLN